MRRATAATRPPATRASPWSSGRWMPASSRTATRTHRSAFSATRLQATATKRPRPASPPRTTPTAAVARVTSTTSTGNHASSRWKRRSRNSQVTTPSASATATTSPATRRRCAAYVALVAGDDAAGDPVLEGEREGRGRERPLGPQDRHRGGRLGTEPAREQGEQHVGEQPADDRSGSERGGSPARPGHPGSSSSRAKRVARVVAGGVAQPRDRLLAEVGAGVPLPLRRPADEDVLRHERPPPAQRGGLADGDEVRSVGDQVGLEAEAPARPGVVEVVLQAAAEHLVARRVGAPGQHERLRCLDRGDRRVVRQLGEHGRRRLPLVVERVVPGRRRVDHREHDAGPGEAGGDQPTAGAARDGVRRPPRRHRGRWRRRAGPGTGRARRRTPGRSRQAPRPARPSSPAARAAPGTPAGRAARPRRG